MVVAGSTGHPARRRPSTSHPPSRSATTVTSHASGPSTSCDRSVLSRPRGDPVDARRQPAGRPEHGDRSRTFVGPRSREVFDGCGVPASGQTAQPGRQRCRRLDPRRMGEPFRHEPLGQGGWFGPNRVQSRRQRHGGGVDGRVGWLARVDRRIARLGSRERGRSWVRCRGLRTARHGDPLSRRTLGRPALRLRIAEHEGGDDQRHEHPGGRDRDRGHRRPQPAEPSGPPGPRRPVGHAHRTGRPHGQPASTR